MRKVALSNAKGPLWSGLHDAGNSKVKVRKRNGGKAFCIFKDELKEDRGNKGFDSRKRFGKRSKCASS